MTWVNGLGETAEEEREMDCAYGTTVDDIGNWAYTFSELGNWLWSRDANNPLTRCSNKFKPVMESKNQRSGMGSYWDRNPRRWESRQIKVANRRWRRSGRYNGQTFDDFESLARSRFSALEDRWYW